MLGHASLRARDDGNLDYLPSVPSNLVQTALRATALQRSAVVGRERKLVGDLACPKQWSMPVSEGTTSFPKTLRERLRDALKARLTPFTNLHPKVLCHELRVSRNTLDNWLSANNDPRGEHLMALMDFFDPAFTAEISNGSITKLPNRRAIEAVRKYHAAKQELMDALR